MNISEKATKPRSTRIKLSAVKLVLEIRSIPERKINKKLKINLNFALKNSISKMPKTKQMNDIAIT